MTKEAAAVKLNYSAEVILLKVEAYYISICMTPIARTAPLQLCPETGTLSLLNLSFARCPSHPVFFLCWCLLLPYLVSHLT